MRATRAAVGEEFGVFWLEEPLPGDDLAGMRALRDQIRVAGGEMARTPAELLAAPDAPGLGAGIDHAAVARYART